MEEIMNVLKNIQDDFAQQKQDMKNMAENIKEAINENIDQKFNLIESKTNQLEQTIQAQQKTIDFLYKQTKKKNLIFFGVPETEKGYEDLVNSILEITNKKMNVVCSKWEIEAVGRIGKFNGKVRPVVVTFTTMSRKLQLLKNKKILLNTGIYINVDYTPAVLQKRKELQEELERKRRSGEKVVLHYDKIVTVKSHEPLIRGPKGTPNKRFLSESPENENKNTEKLINNENQAKRVTKKNKSQHITGFLRPPQLNCTTSKEAESGQKTPGK